MLKEEGKQPAYLVPVNIKGGGSTKGGRHNQGTDIRDSTSTANGLPRAAQLSCTFSRQVSGFSEVSPTSSGTTQVTEIESEKKRSKL